MIEQYLSNTNEKATVSILQNILELNKTKICVGTRGTEASPRPSTMRQNSRRCSAAGTNDGLARCSRQVHKQGRLVTLAIL